MSALGQRLKELIAAQGPLSVAQFMALALMDPTHGYYATRDPFGAAGDFVTAPEISQMFGELIGLWLVDAWRAQDCPHAHLVELGPGRGTLMKDVLRTIAKAAPEFFARAEATLVEASPVLRRAQQKTLGDAPLNVAWKASFDHARGAPFVIANEFFDALPIRQFLYDGEGWRERMVAMDEDGELAFALAPVHARALAAPATRGRPQPGDVYEVCPAGLALTEHLAQTVAAKGGAALIIDYGYDADVGFGDTLQAVKAHAYAGILDQPGEADITAHVDFVALVEAARRGKTSVYGPLPQGAFLDRLGLGARTEALSRANPALGHQLVGDADRLRNPRHMGGLFKAMALMPREAPKPAGF